MNADKLVSTPHDWLNARVSHRDISVHLRSSAAKILFFLTAQPHPAATQERPGPARPHPAAKPNPTTPFKPSRTDPNRRLAVPPNPTRLTPTKAMPRHDLPHARRTTCPPLHHRQTINPAPPATTRTPREPSLTHLQGGSQWRPPPAPPLCTRPARCARSAPQRKPPHPAQRPHAPHRHAPIAKHTPPATTRTPRQPPALPRTENRSHLPARPPTRVSRRAQPAG
jgi:hypothetical protein